ncbi:hypothetical protein [uncultured Flavobacterium sp.]|jgi:hypothetical protein|uniref:DUF4406 domain-containing protein n=1 Tax=uncultured Flavobacterium sp. TaxID=165435 RepID=UPI0030816B6D
MIYKKIYLIGDIGDPKDFKIVEKFNSAATFMRNLGFIVINPIDMFKKYDDEYNKAIKINKDLLLRSDGICILDYDIYNIDIMEQIKMAMFLNLFVTNFSFNLSNTNNN